MPYSGGFPEGFGLHIARARYDFTVDGGVVGDINLNSENVLPSGAIVLGGFVQVVTPPTSGGAGTLAIKVEGAADTVAAAAVSGAPWSTAGRKSVIPVFTGATMLKTTAARKIVATVAAFDLTAGKLDVVLFYIHLGD